MDKTLEEVQSFLKKLGYVWHLEYDDKEAQLSSSIVKYKIAKSFDEIDGKLREFLVRPVNGKRSVLLYLKVSKTEFKECMRSGSFLIGGYTKKDYSKEWNEFRNNTNQNLSL